MDESGTVVAPFRGMKQAVLVILGLWWWGVSIGQEGSGDSLSRSSFVEKIRLERLQLPDSALQPLRWSEPLHHEATQRPLPEKIVVPQRIVVRLRSSSPAVYLIDNRYLMIGRHWILTNGQATLWGIGPAAYLDARTLSFPLQR